MGHKTTSMGPGATAMGVSTKAMGKAATAMGEGANAIGWAATAQGYETYALGFTATSMGYKTAAWHAATSMGHTAEAKGSASVAMGYNTKAQSFAEVVIGQWNELATNATVGDVYLVEGGNNTIDTGNGSVTYDVPPAWQSSDAVFRVGIGTGETDRKDALTVYKSGAVVIPGETYIPQLKMGHKTTSMGPGATAMGVSTKAMGKAATAMGEGANAIGWAATAQGYETYALGFTATSMGYKTAAWHAATSMGHTAEAKGSASVAMGYNTKAQSFAEVVIGQWNELATNATVGDVYLVEGGNNTIDTGNGSVTYDVPPAWQSSDAVFRVGIGTGETDRKDALTVYKNGTVVIPGLILTVGGRRLAAMGGVAEEKVATLKGELASNKEEVATLKGEVATLKEELAMLKAEIQKLAREQK